MSNSKSNSTQEPLARKVMVRPTRFGRRPKYIYPFRLSVLIEGKVSMALDKAARQGVNGKSDLTGVVQDAIKEYLDKHEISVPSDKEYAKACLREVVIP